MLIVDNSCFSFSKNLNNGIPIIPYYDDKNDKELLYLAEFLKKLSLVEDVRNTLKKLFRYKQFNNFTNPSLVLK